jgi:protein phosphatase
MRILAYTEKGPQKAQNEDRAICGDRVLEGGFAEARGSLFAVADGVGGRNAGAVASEFVAQQLLQVGKLTPEALAGINSGLLAMSRGETAGMATTLAGMCLEEKAATLFSVGNCRVYLLQGSYLKQVTVDDTLVQHLLATGQLTQDQARDFDRKNQITACFGGGDPALFKLKCTKVPLPGGAVIITSDGIHDHLTLDEMEDILREKGLSEDACRSLVQAARANGSRDDATAVIAMNN